MADSFAVVSTVCCGRETHRSPVPPDLRVGYGWTTTTPTTTSTLTAAVEKEEKDTVVLAATNILSFYMNER